ncbi:YfbK domain-containing protein [Phenylobacterium sp.]|nr:YfbK domain-containing protein [Phenylobacterium sp.]
MEDRFGWPQVAALAQGARGQDPFGLRAEFVQLVRNADDARALND